MMASYLLTETMTLLDRSADFPAPRFSLSTLLVVVTMVACFFGGRASRNGEVSQLLKDREGFALRTETACGTAIVLREVDGGLCEISVGRDDGLKPTDRGMVVRGDTMVGFVTARQMSVDRCFADVDLRSGTKVQKGDHVQFDFGRR